MKKQIVKIDAAKWFSSRNLRLCSPAARGFLVDLKCLSPGGYLAANGIPLTAEQISSLTGASVTNVNKWMQELAAADAYEVDENGLYFSDMVRKVSGAKPKKKLTTSNSALKREDFMPGGSLEIKPQLLKKMVKNAVEGAKITKEIHALVPDEKSKAAKAMVDKVALISTPPKITAPAKKAAAWYKTPAGWVRKGQEQAIQMQQGEAYEDFQYRVAKRFPEDGAWLEFMPKSLAKKIRDEIAEGKARQDELKKMI